jgi:hypothetical protein
MLQIAYGVGGLSQTFANGDWVLDKIYLLAKRGDPLVVIVANVRTYGKEYIDGGAYTPGVQPKTYDTEEAARAAGEVTQWPEQGTTGPKPTVSPAGEYVLLVRKPEGVECALFGFEVGGKLWTPARMFLDKKAHRNVISEVEKARMFSLAARKGGTLAGQFTLVTQTRVNPKSNKTETFPTAKFTGGNSDADVEKIAKAFIGAAATADAGQE